MILSLYQLIPVHSVLAISKATKTEPSRSQTPMAAQHIEVASRLDQSGLRAQVSLNLSPFLPLRQF